MSRSFILALLLAIPAAAVTPAAQAEPASVAVTNAGGCLAIGGIGIVQLSDKSVCDSVLQRSDRITARLIEALWKVNRKAQFDKIAVSVEPDGAEPWVTVEGVQVMKVTTEDTRATNKDAQTLALHYANQFRNALHRVYSH